MIHQGTKVRTTGDRMVLPAVVVTALLAAGCAEEKIAVFDKAAIDQIRTLMVLPLNSQQEPDAGPIASGMITSRLKAARYKNLSIVEAPALWRLDPGRAKGIADEAAIRAARGMGADAVLTGTFAYSVSLAKSGTLPAGKAAKGVKVHEKFALRKGDGSVNVRILSVAAARPVYAHAAAAKGHQTSALLAKCVEAVLQPLEKHLAKR